MSSCLDLTGRVAVVIGATSGLGQAIALGLAKHGAEVVPAGRRSPEWTADVTKRESLEALRDAVLAKFGHLDVLVNAAGYTSRKPTEQVSDEEWSDMFDTNLAGLVRACQVFYPALKASGKGRIINIASLGSFVAFHEVTAYCASKTAVISVTRSLACEWAKDGICVNAIAPGVFPTELNGNLILGTERGKELLMRTPMGRFGDAEELVGAAVLFASDAASFLTGQCLAVDGGFLASGVNQ